MPGPEASHLLQYSEQATQKPPLKVAEDEAVYPFVQEREKLRLEARHDRALGSRHGWQVPPRRTVALKQLVQVEGELEHVAQEGLQRVITPPTVVYPSCNAMQIT